MEGDNGSTRPIRAEASADHVITRVRPNRSDKALAGMIASASRPVVAETLSADTAGDTEKSVASAGSTACAQYIATKVVIPAANSAAVIRR